MEKHRCQKMIYGGSFHGRSCAKTAKFEHEGKWYCGLHHPPAVKAKRIARDRKWHEKWERQNRASENRKNISEAEHRLVEAALRLPAGFLTAHQFNDSFRPVAIAIAALRELRRASLTQEADEC